jgi:hypothetical protein
MYAGLFLAPWVLMYGVSGFIFNHFSWFAVEDTNQSRWALGPSAAIEGLDANALAIKVVAALNHPAGDGDSPSEWAIAPASRPHFQGDVTLQGKDEHDASVVLVLDPDREHGRTFHGPPPIRANVLALESNEMALLSDAQIQIVTAATAVESNLSDVRFDDVSFPPLALQLERFGKRLDASYDLRSGALTLVAPPMARSLKPSEFLTSLHTSYGYPDEARAAKVRTVRAMFVDAMACLMCFWALSGVTMWWQLKSQRRPGLVVIAATLIVASLVWGGMYRVFSSGG